MHDMILVMGTLYVTKHLKAKLVLKLSWTYSLAACGSFTLVSLRLGLGPIRRRKKRNLRFARE